MATSGNVFYDLLREQFERKNTLDTSTLHRERLADMFFCASSKLSQNCYLEAQTEFWNILQFVQACVADAAECVVDEDAMYCFECYYCYSYNMSSNFAETCEESFHCFQKITQSLMKKYPTRHFPKYLQVQYNLKRKKWLLCLYYCELLKSSSKESSSDNSYKNSQYFHKRLVAEMDRTVCLRNLNKIEKCCYLGYLEQMFDKIDNEFIEEFIRSKRGISFEDIEDDFILSLAMRYQNNDRPDFNAEPLCKKFDLERIDKTDVLNMLLSKALVLQKSVQTQTAKPAVDSHIVQTDMVKTRSIGLQKNDEEVKNRVFEENKIIKNLERQLMEKEIEIKHLKKQQDLLEKEKNQTKARNLILQKLLLQEISEKFNLYTTVSNDIKDYCKFMLKNIADIGPTLTPNTGLDKSEYRIHFDYWMRKSSAITQYIETLNSLYSQIKVNMIYHDNFVTTKWPVIPQIKDDVGFVFRDLKQLIKKHVELEEKLTFQVQSQPRECNQQHPSDLGLNLTKDTVKKAAWNGNSCVQTSSTSTSSNGAEYFSRNRKLNDGKTPSPIFKNGQKKEAVEQQTYFEYIWKAFSNVEDQVVTKALLAVVEKNNGSLANIPKDFIVGQVKEELSYLKKKQPPNSRGSPESDEDIDNDCPICFEALKPKTKCVLSCTHKYHKNCIRKWLRNNTVCPICRVHVDFSYSEFPTLGSTVKLK